MQLGGNEVHAHVQWVRTDFVGRCIETKFSCLSHIRERFFYGLALTVATRKSRVDSDKKPSSSFPTIMGYVR